MNEILRKNKLFVLLNIAQKNYILLSGSRPTVYTYLVAQLVYSEINRACTPEPPISASLIINNQRLLIRKLKSPYSFWNRKFGILKGLLDDLCVQGREEVAIPHRVPYPVHISRLEVLSKSRTSYSKRNMAI